MAEKGENKLNKEIYKISKRELNYKNIECFIIIPLSYFGLFLIFYFIIIIGDIQTLDIDANFLRLSLFLMLIDLGFTYFLLHYFGFRELNNVISNLYNMTPSGLLIFLWCPLVYIVLKIIFRVFAFLKLSRYYKLVLLYYFVANIAALTNNAVEFGMVVS